MKLYLTSYRIPTPEDLFKLFEKSAEKVSTGIITNAKDKKPADERDQKLNDVKSYLSNLGLVRSAFVDLKQYADPIQMGRELARYDMLFVVGGNSFVLNEVMHSTGFSSIVKTLLQSGICYVGESAGAVVAGLSLNGFGEMDDMHDADSLVTAGLGLIPEILVPHNDSPDPRFNGRSADIQKANPESTVIALNDNQAYVVNGPHGGSIVTR